MGDADKRTVQRSDTWHLSDEREFIENVLYQRVNFFIVFYSLILTSAVGARQQLQLTIILILGAIVCTLLTVSIYLVQQKLDILIRLVRADGNHPARTVYDKINRLKWLHDKGVDRKLICYMVPGICSLSLLVGICLSIGNVITTQ
jgi:hypothetical protein